MKTASGMLGEAMETKDNGAIDPAAAGNGYHWNWLSRCIAKIMIMIMMMMVFVWIGHVSIVH